MGGVFRRDVATVAVSVGMVVDTVVGGVVDTGVFAGIGVPSSVCGTTGAAVGLVGSVIDV